MDTVITKDIASADEQTRPDPRACMPLESALPMPVQSFRRFSNSERRRWSAPTLSYTPWLSRLLVFGGGLLLTIYGAMEMYAVVNVGAITTLKWALLILFVANFSWIAIAFTSGVLGFFWLLLRAPKVPALPHALRERTAVVMPIYNEAPSRVFGAVQAMIEDVERTGLGDHFDWFFLSDTTNPDVWIAEEYCAQSWQYW